jgi:hypothetical protein
MQSHSPPRIATGSLRRSFGYPFLAALFCAATLSGCNPTRPEQRLTALDTTLDSYNKLIRWNEFQTAASYIRARTGDTPPIDLEPTRGVRVTRLETLSQGVANDDSEARVQNQLQYYRDDAAVVQTLLDDQLWWYDAELARWFLDGNLPAFK